MNKDDQNNEFAQAKLTYKDVCYIAVTEYNIHPSPPTVCAGTELTISYVDMVTAAASRQERREYLDKHFHFSCQCDLCSLQGDQLAEDDRIRLEVGLDIIY